MLGGRVLFSDVCLCFRCQSCAGGQPHLEGCLRCFAANCDINSFSVVYFFARSIKQYNNVHVAIVVPSYATPLISSDRSV